MLFNISSYYSILLGIVQYYSVSLNIQIYFPQHDSTSGMITGTQNRVSTPSSKTTITNLPPKNSQNSSTEVVQQSSHQCTRALQCDVPVASCDANVMTDMDLLGPCEPGTSVVLEGIVWTESNNGKWICARFSDAHRLCARVHVCMCFINLSFIARWLGDCSSTRRRYINGRVVVMRYVGDRLRACIPLVFVCVVMFKGFIT